MTDRFAGVHRKIERAKHHADDLERQIIDFWDTKPYDIGIEGDPRTGPGAWVIEGEPEPLPSGIIDTAGDAIHNLRAAFDHFAFSVVPVGRLTKVAFPVWRQPRRPTATEWNGVVHGKLQGAPRNLQRAVKSLQVYEGGNAEWLWAVDYLDVVDKHRLLLAIASAHTGIVLDAAAMLRGHFPDHPGVQDAPAMEIPLRLTEMVRVEPGAELFTVEDPNGYAYDGEMKFAFEVTLGEPGVLEGEPLTPTLRRFIDEAEGLLKRLIALA